jgi:hypothetical protein
MSKLFRGDGSVADGWHPLDGVAAPEWIPTQWDGAHCGVRLIQAFKTLWRVPTANGPRFHSGVWPASPMAWIDIVDVERSWRLNPDGDDLHEAVADFSRKRPKPSAEDISRMEAAIAWPARYLASRPHMMTVVQRVAMLRLRDLESDAIARRLRLHPTRMRRINRAGLDVIAAGLHHDKVTVF